MVLLQSLMNFEHLCHKEMDLGDQETSHHKICKVSRFWTNLSNLGALGIDFDTELGNMFSMFVSKFHEL